jgi:hypothetical protein
LHLAAALLQSSRHLMIFAENSVKSSMVRP